MNSYGATIKLKPLEQYFCRVLLFYFFVFNKMKFIISLKFLFLVTTGREWANPFSSNIHIQIPQTGLHALP